MCAPLHLAVQHVSADGTFDAFDLGEGTTGMPRRLSNIGKHLTAVLTGYPGGFSLLVGIVLSLMLIQGRLSRKPFIALATLVGFWIGVPFLVPSLAPHETKAQATDAALEWFGLVVRLAVGLQFANRGKPCRTGCAEVGSWLVYQRLLAQLGQINGLGRSLPLGLGRWKLSRVFCIVSRQT